MQHTWMWACSSFCQALSPDCQTPHCCSWRGSKNLQACWVWQSTPLPSTTFLGCVRVEAQVGHFSVQGLGKGEHLLLHNFLPDFLGFVFGPGVSKLFSLFSPESSFSLLSFSFSVWNVVALACFVLVACRLKSFLTSSQPIVIIVILWPLGGSGQGFPRFSSLNKS